MAEYICSSCGCTIESEADSQKEITCSHCGEVLSVSGLQKLLPSGTRVGGYEIIRHIASGGTGSVYLAEQISMERQVALKILNTDQISSGNAERFLDEARNTAKFENPHVVSVIDTGISDDGCYYIAMQYVEGETLEDILQRGRVFSEEETLIIGITVAEALRTIWNKYKMFHKDIKPGTIMLTRENEAMLLDMGTAQKRGKSLLADGDIEGSPYYMSPEQARGEELGWSSDQYSLGATMYQMVTGKPLYEGPDLEMILRQHDSAPFPEPAARMPQLQISEAMTGILRKMLEKKPAQRYLSWEDFIHDAKKLLKKILAEKGSATPEKLQQKYNEIDDLNKKTELKSKGKVLPSPGRFICYGLLIFILAAALLGGIFLYLAVRRNSANAAKLLEPIRKQVNSLQMDPDAVEELIRKSEPYFNRLGVLPSLRREFAKSLQKVKEFRELNKKEEQRIIHLESLVAEQLQLVDQEISKMKEINDPAQAKKQYDRSIKNLRKLSAQIKKETFVLLPNISRADELQKRLRIALHTVQREYRQYPKTRHQPARKPANPDGVVKKSAAPLMSAKPGKPVHQTKKNVNLPSPASAEGKPPAVKSPVEQEKNRLRVLLMEQLREGQFPVLPALKLKRDTLSAEQQTALSRWLRGMKATVESASRIVKAVYDSHQALAGFYFTVMTPHGQKRMELKKILHDEAILFSPEMEMLNVRLKFSQLPSGEWIDFLRVAAKKKNLNGDLDSYLLLDGWFGLVEKSRNAFVRAEVPLFRKVYYRYLAGEKIPGVPPLKKNIDKETIEKYTADPFFAPFRPKLEQRKRIDGKKDRSEGGRK